ncbi:MAG: hypothetical protein GY856_34355 [bacterium]|nr:hypothetical protein [bacterium]
MSPLGTIFWARRRIVRHTIASVRRESKLKVVFVSISATLLWLGIFGLARMGFWLFEGFGAELLGTGSLSLSDLIMARLLAVFALAVFIMLIFSNVLVAYTTLYRSREVPYLVQSPISPATFFLGRFYECVTFSSWAFAYLGSPVLLAYGLESDAPALFYLSLVAFYLPFVTIPAAIGSIVAVALARLFSHLRRGHWVALGLVAVVLVFGYFRDRLQAPDFSDTATIQAVIDAMGRTQSPFLPSYWVAQGVLSAATGEAAEAGFYLLLLVANALLLVWLATWAAEAWFYPGWSEIQGGDVDRSRCSGGGILGLLDTVLRPLPQPARALVVKDLKLFWRDPAQWSQFVLFFGIMAIYVANLRGARAFTDQGMWHDWASLLNLTACMLILASLTTRFVYPLVSLEGRRFWILGLAPLGMRRIVWQKFWLSVGTTSIFTVTLAILSAVQLDLGRLAFALSVAGIAATTVALSGLAVGLGSLYPNFEEDNPARIVSGMGGTLNFMLSMVYVILVTAAQAVVLLWDSVGRLVPADSFPWAVAAVVAVIIVLTALTCWVPMKLGLRNLERAEF